MTDAQQALAQVREALANEALFDPGASTADTYSACKAFGTACTPENMRAILAHVEAQAAEIERLRADAERYREWLRGGPNIPPESSRWRRWEVRYWDGRYWQTLFGDDLDAAIDEARKA